MYIEKKSKILIGFLAVLLALSVGYALFSDTITITGTAAAKGSFDMGATCEVIDEQGAATGTCFVDGNTISTQSSLTKPGDNVIFRVRVTNNGTIPARLKTFTSPNNSNGQSDVVDGKIVPKPGDTHYIDGDTALAAFYEVNAMGYTFMGDSAILAAASNVTFSPGTYFEIDIYHAWAEVVSEYQPALPEEGVTFSYDIDMGFEQVIQ